MRWILPAVILTGVGVTGLTACGPTIPDSAAGMSAVDSAAAAARRDRLLNGSGSAVPPAGAISDETTAGSEAQTIASEALDAVGQTGQAASGDAQINDQGFVQANPQNPVPLPLDNPGISDENDFEAVGERRSIESDAERMAAIREQYQVIEPSALPSRRGASGPNIVSFALQADNPLGNRKYRRLAIASQARYTRNCARYASPDQAQAAFLSAGGPERDRRGLDPDGDGYACSWDPRPFRKALGN